MKLWPDSRNVVGQAIGSFGVPVAFRVHTLSLKALRSSRDVARAIHLELQIHLVGWVVLALALAESMKQQGQQNQQHVFAVLGCPCLVNRRQYNYEEV
jgi:hypothetical protein